MQGPSGWGSRSVVAAPGLSCFSAGGILVPPLGIEPTPSALQGGLLITGPPGKSLRDISDGHIWGRVIRYLVMQLKIPPCTGWPPSQKITWLEGAAEDEMVGWHHRLNGHEFELTLEDSEG